MLEEPPPEGLHPMERTHSGKCTEGLCPMAGIPGAGKEWKESLPGEEGAAEMMCVR